MHRLKVLKKPYTFVEVLDRAVDCRQSTLDVQQVLAEVRETIAKTEAELEVNEKISVVLEPNRTVLSVERNFRFAKDK